MAFRPRKLDPSCKPTLPEPASAEAALVDAMRQKAEVRPDKPCSDLPCNRKRSSITKSNHDVDPINSNRDERGDYIVGKGRPPVASQWRKGQSGNPRGPRPKEKLDPVAAFDREVTADFTAKVNGETVNLNMGSFALNLLKASAAKGSIKAAQQLLELYLAAVRRAMQQDTSQALADWEQALIDELLEVQGLPLRPVVRHTRDDGRGSGGGDVQHP